MHFFKKLHEHKNHLVDHTCPTCHHHHKGNFCNNCGEKVFHKHDLSLPHLAEETVDSFTHFDLKIPKSLLLLFNPGYLTQKFLKGIRVPYAKPVQLFIIANVLFFFMFKFVGFTDYSPSFGDHTYFQLHDSYPIFRWAKPIDRTVVDAITNAGVQKAYAMKYIGLPSQDSIFNDQYYTNRFTIEFKKNCAVYSKTFIFLLIPLFALFFYAFFFKYFDYFGSSLIYATHFLSYNLLIFGLWQIIAVKLHWYLLNPIYWLAYETPLKSISEGLFGGEFEFLHFIFFLPYFLISFNRLFKIKWYWNILASYFLVRIVYFLTFGVYKKILIALTIWLM
jgi:hypothetical protein